MHAKGSHPSPDNLVSDLIIISQATAVDISTLTHKTEGSLQTMWQHSLSATEAFFLLSIEHLPENCRTTIFVPAYLLSVQHSSPMHCVVCSQQ